MDHDLLRSWLGLPPGPWPPDSHALLGMDRGPCDPAAVEARVLERMDLLRRHQLLYPDLVTEGMNRLAQALITLTDPTEKADHETLPDAAARSPPPSAARPSEPGRADAVVVAEPLLDDDVFSDDAAREPTDAPDLTQIIEVPPALREAGAEPPRGARVVSWEQAPEPPPGTPEVVWDATPSEIVLQPRPARVVPAILVAPPGPRSRRWIYTRLALLRRALRAWDRLRPVLADPQDPVDRPGRVLVFLEAVREVRPLLPALRGLVGGVGEPGGLVAAVVSQPLLLDTFRRLLPNQRQAVAIDWRRGQGELETEYARLRRLAREGRSEAAGPRGMVVFRWLKETPELVLVLLAAVAVLIALIRGAGR